MYTIKNNVHGTEARTKGGRLTLRTMARLRRQLCDCGNCGPCGERGPQDDCEITYDANCDAIVSEPVEAPLPW